MYEHEKENQKTFVDLLSGCLSSFSFVYIPSSFFFIFRGFTVKLILNSNLFVSVSCSEVCQLWPWWSDAVWMQQPIWLSDRGRRSPLCCQDSSALHTPCVTFADHGEWHRHSAAMGGPSQAGAQAAGEYTSTLLITFLTCLLSVWLMFSTIKKGWMVNSPLASNNLHLLGALHIHSWLLP